jgi:2-aminoadipate transaminase
MNPVISNRMANLNPSAIREMLKLASPDMISFTAGNPSAVTFPQEELKEAIQEILTNQPALALQYSVTEGYAPLIEITKERLATKYNIPVDSEMIITSGAQQAIDLAAKCLLNSGDVVICETPSFIGALNAFRSYGARLEGVPVDDDGMIVDAVEDILKREKRVKLIYTIPTFQNPTGTTMPMERRKKLLELAIKYNVLLLEDNPYFELSFSGEIMPPIKTMDFDDNVLYVGSYSKIISPGIRVGYALGPKSLLSKMTVSKQSNDVHTTMLMMMAVEKMLRTFDFDSHINRCRELYKRKAELMISEMDKKIDKRVHFTRPQGGLFVWGELPKGRPSLELCAITQRHKLVIVPGMTFTTTEDPSSTGFRLNFSVPTEEQIVKGVELLAESIDEYLGSE